MKMKKKGNENEVKMTMRWKLRNQDAKRGTQKKREGENTNTWNLARSGRTLKRQGKRKSGGTTDTEQDQRRRGKTEAPEPTWHGANLQQPQHATGQTYLEGGERKNTWKRKKRGPMGNKLKTWCIHNACSIRDKAQRPSAFKSTPSTAVSVQMNYVHNWTSPTTIRKKNHTCKDVLLPVHVKWPRTVSWEKQKNCCRGFQLCRSIKRRG